MLVGAFLVGRRALPALRLAPLRPSARMLVGEAAATWIVVFHGLDEPIEDLLNLGRQVQLRLRRVQEDDLVPRAVVVHGRHRGAQRA